MPIGNTAVVPAPSALLNGVAPGYRRRVGYLNTTTNKVEGDRTEIYLYNGRGSATLAGGVYTLQYDGDEETSPRVITCAATTWDTYVVVSPIVIADATWGWFAIEGYVDALVDGGATDVAKDDTLKIVVGTNADAFVQDTASMVPTTDTFAIACEANTSTELVKKVYLFGQRGDLD